MLDETSSEYAQRITAAWSERDTSIRSWWQSDVVVQEIRRRITGDTATPVERYFRDRYCATGPFSRALSLGSGEGGLEEALLSLNVCRELVGVDLSDERIELSTSTLVPRFPGRVRFEKANIESWIPPGEFDLVACRDVLHHIVGLERVCDTLLRCMTPGAVLYIDEFVGPDRFQWTDAQVNVIARLLECLPAELVTDLVQADGTVRRTVPRPPVEAMIDADPSEAARSSDIIRVLDDRFERVEVKPYGGAVFHQLFNRIMGNFAEHETIVRVIMEVDFMLVDYGVLPSDYMWAVYRVPAGSTART